MYPDHKTSGHVRLSPERGTWHFERKQQFVLLDAWHRNPIMLQVAYVTDSGGLVGEDIRGGRHYGPPDSDRVWPLDLFHPNGARIPFVNG